MIEFKNVSKVYDNDVEAVKTLNLTINDGEFVFLVGESGSGKSTLLKLLMRELKPTTGEIIVNGIDITKLKKRRVAEYRRTLGVVFQDYRLLPKRTVYDNVAYALEVIEESNRRIRRRVPAVLNQVGLVEKYRSMPNEISGGEQQRTAIARAIVNEPAIVLADEPTGNLDPRNSEDIMLLMESINNKGTTVIIATHDRNMVNAHKKRVIHLKDGVIVRDSAEGGYDDEN
jgi:cell division transport system ATP-binding protein